MDKEIEDQRAEAKCPPSCKFKWDSHLTKLPLTSLWSGLRLMSLVKGTRLMNPGKIRLMWHLETGILPWWKIVDSGQFICFLICHVLSAFRYYYPSPAQPISSTHPSVYPYTYPPTHPPNYLFTYYVNPHISPFYPSHSSTYPFIHHLAYPPVHPSHLFINPSTCLPIYPFSQLLIHPFVSPIHLSLHSILIFPSIHPSIHPPTHPSSHQPINPSHPFFKPST